MAAVQGVANGVIIDERAARTVDQHRPRRHHGELFRADHALGFRRSARVQANDARTEEQFIEFDILRQISKDLRLGVGIIRKDVTSDPAEHSGYAAADRAVADQTSSAILQFQSALVVLVVITAPFTVRERRVRFGNAA